MARGHLRNRWGKVTGRSHRTNAPPSQCLTRKALGHQEAGFPWPKSSQDASSSGEISPSSGDRERLAGGKADSGEAHRPGISLPDLHAPRRALATKRVATRLLSTPRRQSQGGSVSL